MISFPRLLGREDEFFGLLEASAAECVASITALRAILNAPGESLALDAFATARRKDKEITQRLEEMLIHTFVTPIEREDIESLADRLYKIPKVVEKFAERYALVAPRVADVRFDGLAEALQLGVSLLRKMVAALRASDIDMVYLTGYGFPAYRGGPMFYADTVGLKNVLNSILKFQAGYQGAVWKPAPLLVKLANEGRTFNG